jgi:glycolate oxidase
MKTLISPEKADIEIFKEVLGEDGVFSDKQHLTEYSHDETEDLVFEPEVVLKPVSAQQISLILKHCNHRCIAVTARGGGTGLSGGALPVKGGVLLSMEKMNKIISIDEENLQATVEPGVITQVFQEAVIERGLFYPPDPSSRGSCFIGGNIAHNSGGPRAVKYGVTRDYVLNLQVVLASGEILWTGANTLKNSTGYSLTHLFIGSEGTLGIITAIVFKLIPYPRHRVLMLAPFRDPEAACRAVGAVFRAGFTPSAMEFMERDAIDWTLKYVSDISLVVGDDENAHLLVELDGNREEMLLEESSGVAEVLEREGALTIHFAESEDQKNRLWKMRRSVAEAVKAHSIYKEEDTVVMRASLPVLLSGVKEIGNRYGFKSVCYGHAGDGNLHVNIIKGDIPENKWESELPEAIREIFRLCKNLGGTLSGEHGVGFVQKNYLNEVQSDIHIALQKDIKSIFDPHGILNPGKIFP